MTLTDATPSLRMTPRRVEMLREAADENVGFIDTARGRSFRRWLTDHDYETVTPIVAPLVAAGLLSCHHGYMFGQGFVEPTPAGRDALHDALCAAEAGR